uniref:Uncharacterized protein n=1 Tax=Arundo donax TaxID=35708 RepID=A0A0A8XXL0_ARUDO
MFLSYMSPRYFFLKLAHKCLMHSLCSILGNTSFTAPSRPLHASVDIAKAGG